jgi:D-lyxose ketol-isomerase
MKRSEINTILRDADTFIRQHSFYLPPFAYWTPDDWSARGKESSEIAQNRLGWDITDFGSGDFTRVGLVLFTIRNGSPENLKTGQGKTYAEKILLVDVDQVTPLHFHWQKMEDIINRGGGRLAIQLYNATQDEGLADSDVLVSTDGVERCVKAGEVIMLNPGESITLPPYCYHKFWAVESRVLAGEVSVVNDDLNDNRFLELLGRFPQIDEDEAPAYLLVTDYSRYYQPDSGSS